MDFIVRTHINLIDSIIKLWIKMSNMQAICHPCAYVISQHLIVKKEGALTLRATSGWLLIRTYRGWGKQGHASDDDDHNVDVDVNKER